MLESIASLPSMLFSPGSSNNGSFCIGLVLLEIRFGGLCLNILAHANGLGAARDRIHARPRSIVCPDFGYTSLPY